MNGLVLLSSDEERQQLGLVKCGPFNNHAQGPRRDPSSQHRLALNIDFNAFASIKGVKVGRIMICKINLDHNAVKTADLRHGLPVPAKTEINLPEIVS